MLDRTSGPDTSSSGDPLSDLLMGMRLRGASYGKLSFSPPFGVAFARSDHARFHFVAHGEALLRTADGDVLSISSGDAVLFPRGEPHALISSKEVRTRPYEEFETVPLCSGVCAIEARSAETCRTKDVLIFTASMEFELGTMHPLIELMPPFLFVCSLLGRQPEIRPLLEAMEREMTEERVGSAGILARLADVVAASVVRGWVERGCGNATGWVAALRDERLGRVLAALHREPGRDWTLAEMAATMGCSRSVFAERFAAATGTTPLRYLSALRMRLASEWIGRERMPIDLVARRLGYRSQAAFSRAYRRLTGHPPGQARRLNGQRG
ncbi:AraC family transcriptional regulator [Lutibaculum baratangense]|uniref:Transcriptional regulator, AraC family n=1 Tax=Lutibaculum baratangense AMV1 TaxID=631454 RepID=V4T8F1_9HYPH|nr:AraC family transcriptional regulator [Lutibaculum baratangense]ESR22848.1 Transcriptional regulator, AraC family [Lutibaculum baratangense AMV1]